MFNKIKKIICFVFTIGLLLICGSLSSAFLHADMSTEPENGIPLIINT